MGLEIAGLDLLGLDLLGLEIAGLDSLGLEIASLEIAGLEIVCGSYRECCSRVMAVCVMARTSSILDCLGDFNLDLKLVAG